MPSTRERFGFEPRIGDFRHQIALIVTLFVSIYNLFSSLLHRLGFFFGED